MQGFDVQANVQAAFIRPATSHPLPAISHQQPATCYKCPPASASASTASMVATSAGAVVVSSQVTSVRAANLLASFIIVPMALLIQAEAAALFWGNHAGLWWLTLALAITAVVLMRMGIRIFNREELMGQEIDQLRLGWIFRQLWTNFSGRSQRGYPNPIAWYRQPLAIIPRLKLAILAQLIALLGAVGLGMALAYRFEFPPSLKAELTGENMMNNLRALQFLLAALPLYIIVQNIRAMLLQTLLGVFTFGVLNILVFMIPWGLISFTATQFALAGQNPFLFVLGTVVPHAVIELPALLLSAAAGLRWHVVVIAPPPSRTLSEAFLAAMADFLRLFLGVVIPLLILAALLESFLTPQVLGLLYQ